MNHRSRFKLLFAVLCTLALCAILVVWFDLRRASLPSREAEIKATSYTVGIDHSGVITKQYVQVGDNVRADQTLFTVRSASLGEQIKELDLRADDVLYPLNEQGEVLIKAARPGIISEIKRTQGSFVPANEEIATIVTQDSLEVVARYRMPRRDYNKLNPETALDIELPSGEWTVGAIRNIEVTKQEEQELEVEITAAIDHSTNTRFRSANGVPVDTTIRLANDTYYSQIIVYVESLIQKVGSR